MVNRRSVVVALGSLGVFGVLDRPVVAALAGERSPHFLEAWETFRKGREPVTDGGLTLDMPEHAENGNMVLFKLAVDSPMTEAEHVTAIHLLSTLNPHAHVATFRLSRLSGRATVNGRMRLAKTQDVVALADLSDGRLLMTTRHVGVTIGGCGL